MGQRFFNPNEIKPVVVYTTNGDSKEMGADEFLETFCWGHPLWTTDEAWLAAFERITTEHAAAKKQNRAGTYEDQDWLKVLEVLRQVTYQGTNAISFTIMRGRLVNVPTKKSKERS